MINLEFLKKKKVFKKNNVQPDPNIYWLVIFATGLVLIFMAFAFGLNFFLKINQETSLPVSLENSRLKKISKERINKALEVFTLRKSVSDEILITPSGLVDPSI